MTREIKLINYLPEYLRDYIELEKITSAEDPEFKLLVDESERVKLNQFIQTCDIEGIERYENMLRIVPMSDDNLASRIARVMLRWNDVIPYTYFALVTKLISLSGDDNFDINIDHNQYKIDILTHLDLPGQVDELQYLLGYIRPQNMELISSNEINCDSDGYLYSAVGMAYCDVVDLSDAYSKKFDINGDAVVAGAQIGTVNVTLSDAYNENIGINGDAIIAGVQIGTAGIVLSDAFRETIEANGNSVNGGSAAVANITGIN